MTIDQAGPYKGTFLPDPVEDIEVPLLYLFLLWSCWLWRPCQYLQTVCVYVNINYKVLVQSENFGII